MAGYDRMGTELGSFLGRLSTAGRAVAVVAALVAVPAMLAAAVVTTDGDDRAELAVATVEPATTPTAADTVDTATSATSVPDQPSDEGPDAIAVDGTKPGPTTTTTTHAGPTTTGGSSTTRPTTGSTGTPTANTVPETRGTTVTSPSTAPTTVTTPPTSPSTGAPTTAPPTTAPPTTAPPTTAPATTAPPTTAPPTTAPTTVPMPELVGLDHDDASEHAGMAQRQLGYFATSHSSYCAGNVDPERFGLVYEQSPAPGSPLHVGTPITYRWYDTCTRVPSVVGMQFDEAQVALRDAGLQSAASTVCIPGSSDYSVVSQDPGPGGIVPQGTTVAIVVNRGGCVD
jgi:hypothetical protein